MIEWFSSPQGLALMAALVPVISSVLAAIFPDGHWSMKIVNALALNFGKAKNDSSIQ